ncbi:NADPH oxidase 4 [Armadillidium vulgare]|nr:NADPH oxidase 4 [Armadillidium vulgare]
MISYPVVIAIAGGIGITPLLASLSYLMKTCEPKPRHFHIVWVFRELEMPFPFLQFFQSALDKFWVENQEDRLELGFYCTQASSDLEAQLNLAPKYYRDLAPFLRARLKSEVGVFCCGPKSLNKQISRFCLRAVGEGLRFSYHHESFS